MAVNGTCDFRISKTMLYHLSYKANFSATSQVRNDVAWQLRISSFLS